MKREPSEKDIEQALIRRVTRLGGLCEKFTSPGKRSVPDRIVILCPHKHSYTFAKPLIIFVELKAPGKRPTKAQLRDHKKRHDLGCDVRVIDSLEQVNRFPL